MPSNKGFLFFGQIFPVYLMDFRVTEIQILLFIYHARQKAHAVFKRYFYIIIYQFLRF